MVTEGTGIWDLTSGNDTWQFVESTGILSLAVVPEPSSFALLFGIFGMPFVALRRRYGITPHLYDQFRGLDDLF